MTKRQHLIEQCHTLALCIGLRPAARKLGIKEQTAGAWAHRYGWNLSEVFKLTHCPAHSGPVGSYAKALQSNANTAHAALEATFREQAEDTRLFLSAAALKASHQASKSDGVTLLGKIESQSVLNTARTADVVHGWTAARQQPQVQVAVQVNMPTPEEQAQREADHRRMDELTAKLRAMGGGGGSAPAATAH